LQQNPGAHKERETPLEPVLLLAAATAHHHYAVSAGMK